MSSKYTKKEFQKDLKKLAQLIEEHDKMERRQRGGMEDSMSEEMMMGGRRRRRQQRRQRGVWKILCLKK